MTFVLMLAVPVALIVFAILFRLWQIRRARRINPPYVSPGGTLPDFFHGHTWPNPNRRSAR